MLYGCGLRCFELCNLQFKDLGFDRKMLHIRQGKGRKDRYVPLSQLQVRVLKKYILAENPVTWCFTGNNKEGKAVPLSTQGVRLIVQEACKHSGIQKESLPIGPGKVMRHTCWKWGWSRDSKKAFRLMYTLYKNKTNFDPDFGWKNPSPTKNVKYTH